MSQASQIASYARLLRLKPIEDAPSASETSVPTIVPARARRRSYRSLPALALLVIIPTCLAVCYFWLLAANRYESEARFILRAPGRSLAGAAASNLMQNLGASRASDDGYIVKEFLESRDAVAFLEGTVGLRQVLSKGNSDPFWRFPPYFAQENEERLYSFYERMMSASFDAATGVSTLRIQAFTPEDSHALAKALLNAAEALVNRLNERARRDAVSLAELEAERMRQRALAAQTAMTAFRNRERLVDPSQSTLAVLETIGRLSIEAAELSVQLNEIGMSSLQSPQLPTLRNRRGAVEEQISVERSRLAGDTQAIAPRIAEYERLMLESEFATKALVAAMTAVELARVEGQRQQVYLERVAEPSRPDYPAYPLRIVWSLTILAAGYMAYRIWCILSSDARRHSEL